LRFRWQLALVVAGLLVASVPAAGQGAKTPSIPDTGIEQRLGEQVPLDLHFVDEIGQEVELRKYFTGKPVVLVLAYFQCPRLCSVVLNGLTDGLRQVYYEMGKDYTVLTISFDPREKPELAAAKKTTYVESYGRPGAEKGWHFLTGDEPQIKRLADAVGFRYAFDAKKGEYSHGSGIMVLTPQGKVSCYFYGIDFPPGQLALGLEDASAGTIGSPIARPLRLLCFGYDPVTGRYTLMAMRLVRLTGGAALLLLAAWLWLLWRRERRRSRSSALAPPGAAASEARAG
jgi:protein SCO1/2